MRVNALSIVSLSLVVSGIMGAAIDRTEPSRRELVAREVKPVAPKKPAAAVPAPVIQSTVKTPVKAPVKEDKTKPPATGGNKGPSQPVQKLTTSGTAGPRVPPNKVPITPKPSPGTPATTKPRSTTGGTTQPISRTGRTGTTIPKSTPGGTTKPTTVGATQLKSTTGTAKATTAKSDGASCAIRIQKRGWLYRRCEGEGSTMGEHKIPEGTKLQLHPEVDGARADHTVEVTTGKHLGTGSTGVAHDVASHQLGTEKPPLVVKKMLNKDSVEDPSQELNNLRTVKQLEASGSIDGHTYAVMHKAPGVPLEETGAYRDAHHGEHDDTTAAAKQDRVRTDTERALRGAQKRLADNHEVIQADVQTGNANFREHNGRISEANFFDFGNVTPMPKGADGQHTADQKKEIRKMPDDLWSSSEGSGSGSEPLSSEDSQGRAQDTRKAKKART